MSTNTVEECISLFINGAPARKKDAITALQRLLKEPSVTLGFKPNAAVMTSLFSSLSQRLTDANWSIVHPCLQLLPDLVRVWNSSTLHLLPQLLPSVALCLGDLKVMIRKAAVSALDGILRELPAAAGHVTKMFTDHVIGAADAKLRTEGTNALLQLLPLLRDVQSALALHAALCSQLKDCSETSRDLTMKCLAQLAVMHPSALPAQPPPSLESVARRQPQALKSVHTLELIVDSHQDGGAFASSDMAGGGELLWGCVPSALLGDLGDSSDWRLRAAAVEQLLRIFEGLASQHAANGCLQPQQQPLLLPPHTSSFLDMLLKLLRDANFKVELTAMQILVIFVHMLGVDIRPHYSRLLPPLLEKLGDSKIVLRQIVTRVLMQLMQLVSPRIVVTQLLATLQHRNWRVRQEVILLMTQVVRRFDEEQLDSSTIVQGFAACCSDVKPCVRQAALDGIASMYSIIGHRIYSLIEMLDEPAIRHLKERFQEIDSKADSISAAGTNSFSAAQLSLDTGRSGGLWEPIKMQPLGYGDDQSGRFERSNSLDSHSSDGFGFNARDGSGLYESQSPDSLYGSSSPTDSLLENLSMPPPALTRTASQPNPSADSYLYSPFKSGAAPASTSLSERKPPRAGGSSAWAESFNEMDMGMDGRERQHNPFADGSQREPAPVWLSRNDSASSSSSYGGGQRLSHGSLGDGDGLDDDFQRNQQHARHSSQPVTRPLSGRRALPLAPLSPVVKTQSSAGLGISHVHAQVHESDHDRRQLPAPRPPAAAAAASSAPLVSAEQRAWSASAALTGSSDADNGDRAGTGQPRRRLGFSHFNAVSAPGTAAPGSRQGAKPRPSLLGMSSSFSLSSNASASSAGVSGASSMQSSALPSPSRDSVMSRASTQANGSSSSLPPASQPAMAWSTPEKPRREGKSILELNSKPIDYTLTEDLKPLDEPARKMQEALQQFSGGEWNLQMEALNTIRSLSLFHSELLKGQPGGVSQLHAIMLQVLALCDSLRSTLAKSALMCVEDMIRALRSSLDAEVDIVFSMLLRKCTETSVFIADEAKRTVFVMMENVSLVRVVNSLLQHATHKNTAYRSKVALLADHLVDKHGSALSDRDLERIFHAAATGFSCDSAQETRNSGKRLLVSLQPLLQRCGSWDRLNNLLPPSDAARVASIIEKESVGSRPAGGAGGLAVFGGSSLLQAAPASVGMRGDEVRRVRASGIAGASSKGTSLAATAPAAIGSGVLGGLQGVGSGSAAATATEAASAARKSALPAGRRGPAMTKDERDMAEAQKEMEILPNIVTSLASADFRVRGEGLAQLYELMARLGDRVGSKLIPMTDHIVARLGDGNSKIVLQALKILGDVVKLYTSKLEPAAPSIVAGVSQSIAAALSSIRQAAEAVMIAIVSSLDAVALLQPVCSAIEYGNPRSRSFMLQTLQGFVLRAHRAKPQLLFKFVIPVLCKLLEEHKGEVKTATTQLLSHLHASLGDELTDPSSVAKLPDAAQCRRRDGSVTRELQARLMALLKPQGLHVGLGYGGF